MRALQARRERTYSSQLALAEVLLSLSLLLLQLPPWETDLQGEENSSEKTAVTVPRSLLLA